MKHIAIIILAMTLLAGCTSVPAGKSELSKLPYPKAAPLGDDLHIVVVQHDWIVFPDTLEMTNITPRSYHDVQVWLNQQYVAIVKEIPMATGGKSMDILLTDFIDRHQRSYPVSGFLAPDRSYPVVLAELFDPISGKRHRLLVER